mmetsp:Transcript_45708/g.105600  ORF Transcript_45708/g.105600 Transcript_45708/m.105600 type:complete len:207 (-) Transcript_45708:1168-1788(-)
MPSPWSHIGSLPLALRALGGLTASTWQGGHLDLHLLGEVRESGARGASTGFSRRLRRAPRGHHRVVHFHQAGTELIHSLQQLHVRPLFSLVLLLISFPRFSESGLQCPHVCLQALEVVSGSPVGLQGLHLCFQAPEVLLVLCVANLLQHLGHFAAQFVHFVQSLFARLLWEPFRENLQGRDLPSDLVHETPLLESEFLGRVRVPLQ